MKQTARTAVFLLSTLAIPVMSYAQSAGTSSQGAGTVEPGTAPTTRESTTTSDARKSSSTAMNESQSAGMPVETIGFTKGSSALSSADQERLRTFIENARTHGAIKDIRVAVWSDHETPAKAEKNLSKADRKLAEQRGDHIKKFIRDELKQKDVTVYNMAEGTNKLAEAFHTEKAELRSAFAKKGGDEKLRPEVLLIRDHGKPSSAVILIEHEPGASK